MNKTTTRQSVEKSRRRALGALTVGAATAKLPELWARPIVESVLLPAHAVATNEVLRSGGGGGGSGDPQSGSVLPLLDGLVPKAHAVNSDYLGCASFEWITDADGSTWQPDSLRLILLTKDCPLEPHLYEVLSNLPMVHTSGDNYEAIGDGEWNVRLEMTNPLAGPGDPFGICNVKQYNSFQVFRGETCSADHPDIDSCGSPTCVAAGP